MTLFIIGAVIVVCVVGLGTLMLTGQRAQVEARVDGLSPSRSGTGTGVRALSGSVRSATNNSGGPNNSQSQSERLNERIVQAGFYKRSSVIGYYVCRVALAILPFTIAIAAVYLGHLSLTWGFVFAVIAAAVGTVVPSLMLDYVKTQRQTKMRRALPDAIDVIIVCVEAGLSLPAAMTRVAKELRTAHPMLAAEMAICQREVQMGCSSGEALKHLAKRFDLEELRSLASVVQQAERFGASIVNALRVHAEALRTKRFQAAEERAQKAAVYLVFPTILCIFPALFIVLAGPAVFRIFDMFDKMSGG